MGKVVTFGEIMLRLSPEGFYRLFQNDRMQAAFGGAEANVAASLAMFGESAAFVTKVPDQVVGHSAMNALEKFGVDVSNVVYGGERLGIYYYEKGAGPRSSVCIYDRNGSAIQRADEKDFNWNQIFEGADWFHFTGITPALGDGLTNICKSACKAAKEKGITISCDLNYRSKLWTEEEARKTMSELSEYVDICIGNEEDARRVFGIETDCSDVEQGKLDISGYKNIALELKKQFDFQYIAFTLRTSYSASCNDWAGLLFDGQNFYCSKEYHLDYIVDRVGSGDSFSAGLIYGLRNNWDGQKTVEFAAAASALKHSIEGDFNRVTSDEVLKLAEGSGSGRIER